MRANRRFQLFAIMLGGALGACADDDPFTDPNTPLAEFRVDVPAPLPESEQPNVLLLLDTSGSMQWREDCSCDAQSGTCSECLPSCEADERSRWHRVLEALTGSFARSDCETTARADSYDRNYVIPNVQLGADLEQRNDGLLARYGTYVRFGLATFDSVPAYGNSELVTQAAFDWSKSHSAEGMSSYAGALPELRDRARVRADGSVVGLLNYPASAGPFLIDTGIRSESAREGALVLPSADESRSARHVRITEQLMGVRPFGTSPIAAALDDAYFALRRQGSSTGNYVVLITDGPADDDFRKFPTPGCGCRSLETCGEDPSPMSCPYPLPEDAARYLRCGFDEDCDGPATQLFVVGLTTQAAAAQSQLDAIAAAGGSDAARFVSGLSDLNVTLDDIVQRIVRATTSP
jgi:hypothetical protein